MPRRASPSRREIIDHYRRTKMRIRQMASDWQDDLPGQARMELHKLANEMAAFLNRVDPQEPHHE